MSAPNNDVARGRAVPLPWAKGEMLIEGKGLCPSWTCRDGCGGDAGYAIIELTGADFGCRGWLKKEKAWEIRHLPTGAYFRLVPSADDQPNLKEAIRYAHKLIEIGWPGDAYKVGGA